MSHLIAENLTDLRVDFLNQDNYSGGVFSFFSPASLNTDITTTSTSITLYSGSSYYVECSLFAQTTNKNGAVVWQFYSDTDSTFIGQSAHTNLVTHFGTAARVGRHVSSALILDSDISTSKTISVRTVSLTGTGWLFSMAGLASHINFVGYPTLRVMQLPS